MEALVRSVFEIFQKPVLSELAYLLIAVYGGTCIWYALSFPSLLDGSVL